MAVVEEKVSSYLSYFHPEDKLIRRGACIFVMYLLCSFLVKVKAVFRPRIENHYNIFIRILHVMIELIY